MGQRSGRTSRTRSGCRKCRERRVKCPEQRPICRSCQRLGFTCSYDLALSWLEVETCASQKGTTAHGKDISVECGWPVEAWMFLNANTQDFHVDGETISALQDHRRSSISPKPRPAVPWRSVHAQPAVAQDRLLSLSTEVVDNTPKQVEGPDQVPLYLSPCSFSPSETYLWTYFDRYITPQCVLNPDFNPYRDIILKIAATSRDGPLFHCVLAVAANQLHSVGYTEYKPAMWLHRAKALHLLRTKLDSLDTATASKTQMWDSDARDQIIATTLMLCFFDILQDCSRSWVFHTRFAGAFLLSNTHRGRRLGCDQELLHHFAITYIHSHNILAATAGTEADADSSISNDVGFPNNSILEALTGCSDGLLTSISEINRLGLLMREAATYRGDDMIKRLRNDIERRLHQQDSKHGRDTPAVVDSEMATVAKVKRLAALMYLYSRIDSAGPQEPCMVRITTQILSLLPMISLRTNTILWPLFIVAVLGIRPERDEDRKVVLTRLNALQETRQLGNVKKARGVIEDVWKARDLRHSEACRGWTILEGRDQALSLA